MVDMLENHWLAPNELAFHFVTSSGIEARSLANFLARAATVAKRHGAELRIVGIREGSVRVILRVIAKNAAKEFVDKPIDGTLKVTTIVGAVAAAIIYLMTPDKAGETPIAKAGADMVIKQDITQIILVTRDKSAIVMDKATAIALQELVQQQEFPRLLASDTNKAITIRPEVVEMIADARAGKLIGEIIVADDQLHFRPKGYHFMITGDIIDVGGRPDRLIIYSAVGI
jgi:hypothetical protein